MWDAGEELCMLFWDAGEEPGEVRRKQRICLFWDVPTSPVRRTAAGKAPVGLWLLLCALSHPKMGILFAHHLKFLCAFCETSVRPSRSQVSAFRNLSFEMILDCLITNTFL